MATTKSETCLENLPDLPADDTDTAEPAGRFLASSCRLDSNLQAGNASPGQGYSDRLASLAGLEPKLPEARARISRACDGMARAYDLRAPAHTQGKFDSTCQPASGQSEPNTDAASQPDTTCKNLPANLQAAQSAPLTPLSPPTPIRPIPRPALPHLATLTTAEDFHYAGMLSAAWLAAFAEHVDQTLAARVRAYSDRALTRWLDFFADRPLEHAAAAHQIACVEPTFNARGRRSGHDHIYGDGHRVRCPAIAPFTV